IREVVKATSNIITVAGTGVAGFSGDGGPATAAQLKSPYYLVLDGDGNLYFSDTMNQRVREVVKATGNIITVAGTGSWGYNGDGIQATAASLFDPMGLALDSSGNLFIVDPFNYRIREVAAGTGIITTVAGNGSAGYNGDGIPATQAKLAGSE